MGVDVDGVRIRVEYQRLPYAFRGACVKVGLAVLGLPQNPMLNKGCGPARLEGAAEQPLPRIVGQERVRVGST